MAVNPSGIYVVARGSARTRQCGRRRNPLGSRTARPAPQHRRRARSRLRRLDERTRSSRSMPTADHSSGGSGLAATSSASRPPTISSSSPRSTTSFARSGEAVTRSGRQPLPTRPVGAPLTFDGVVAVVGSGVSGHLQQPDRNANRQLRCAESAPGSAGRGSRRQRHSRSPSRLSRAMAGRSDSGPRA